MNGLVIERDRDTLLQFPSRIIEVQRSAVGLIGHDIALTFVHAVVSEQFALVAGEVMAVGSSYLVQREGFGPEARFEHVSGEAVTEVERCGGVEVRLIG